MSQLSGTFSLVEVQGFYQILPDCLGVEQLSIPLNLLIAKGFRFSQQALISEGYAADDGVALHFFGTRLKKIVSSRPHAKAYRLEKVGETVKESPLEPKYIGDILNTSL